MNRYQQRLTYENTATNAFFGQRAFSDTKTSGEIWPEPPKNMTFTNVNGDLLQVYPNDVSTTVTDINMFSTSSNPTLGAHRSIVTMNVSLNYPLYGFDETVNNPLVSESPIEPISTSGLDEFLSEQEIEVRLPYKIKTLTDIKCTRVNFARVFYYLEYYYYEEGESSSLLPDTAENMRYTILDDVLVLKIPKPSDWVWVVNRLTESGTETPDEREWVRNKYTISFVVWHD